MTSLSVPRAGFKNDFSVIADSFLHAPGLPFASVLDAESIEPIFREEKALFGQDGIFSTQIVLWAFLAQTLRDGKGVACSAAVADIATYLLQMGQRKRGDTIPISLPAWVSDPRQPLGPSRRSRKRQLPLLNPGGSLHLLLPFHVSDRSYHSDRPDTTRERRALLVLRVEFCVRHWGYIYMLYRSYMVARRYLAFEFSISK